SQDIEIFYMLSGFVPAPLFDTQIAAMVCGFGESASYATLVSKVTGQHLDKTSRFTDWSKRPLSKKQQLYALSDVTHLRDVYHYLSEHLDKSNRISWVEEEMAALTDPKNYEPNPKDAWKRIRTR